MVYTLNFKTTRTEKDKTCLCCQHTPDVLGRPGPDHDHGLPGLPRGLACAPHQAVAQVRLRSGAGARRGLVSLPHHVPDINNYLVDASTENGTVLYVRSQMFQFWKINLWLVYPKNQSPVIFLVTLHCSFLVPTPKRIDYRSSRGPLFWYVSLPELAWKKM